MTEAVVTLVTTEVAVQPVTTVVVAVTDDGSTIVENPTAVLVESRDVIGINVGGPSGPGEGGGSGDPAGTAAALVSAHEAAADPHPQYMTEAEGDGRYSLLLHTHPMSDVTGLAAALAAKVDLSSVGMANGVAGLDGSGKLNPSSLPALAITDTYPVASQAAMLALACDVGDVAIRSDVNKTFILRQSPPSVLANWSEMLTPTAAVSSVFGRVGAVTAQAGDYAVAQITGLQSALDAKVNASGGTMTGQLIVNGQAVRVQGWSGVAGDGVVYFGDAAADDYIFKQGATFRFNAGGNIAVLNTAGTIWTTGNLASPLTTNNAPNAQDTNNGGRLGRNAATIGDWNDATHNGWYMAAGAANAPIAGIWFMGRVTHHNDAWIQQELFCFTSGAETTRYRRHMSNGTWGAWTSKIYTEEQIVGRSRVVAMNGPIDTAPATQLIQLLYVSSVFDGGMLSCYDYAAGAYKPIRVESSTFAFAPLGGSDLWASGGAGVNSTFSAFRVNGGIRAMGGSSQLGFNDRSTGREFCWYATGDQVRLFNGSGTAFTIELNGNITAQFYPSGGNGAHFQGNGAGTQHNGIFYANGAIYQLAANGAVWVRNPRTFVGSTVDINQMQDGDVFIEI